MKVLSKSIKAHRSFLSLDLLSERPPSRLRGLSLAAVDIPRHWRNKSGTQRAPSSVATSPAKTVSSDDFSSTGGDLLPDEVEHQTRDKEAIEHVARLMAANTGSNVKYQVWLLEQQISGEENQTDGLTPRPSRSMGPLQRATSNDTLHTRTANSLAIRRGSGPMYIDTGNMRSWHSRRPFSFYEGDDAGITSTVQTAPPDLNRKNSWSSSQSSQDSSQPHFDHLAPTTLPEHVRAKAKREDSSSSVITSVQRSPLSDGAHSSPAGIGDNNASHATSPFNDQTNKDTKPPSTPKMANPTSGMRSTKTVVPTQASAHSASPDAEKGGNAGSRKSKGQHRTGKRQTPKRGEKQMIVRN